MVTGDGVVKIVDFGIAKLVDQTGATRTGVTLGTVAYMSPEQLEGNRRGRSDIWSLGATMYEMLTGERPFNGDNAFTVMKAIGTCDPVPLKTLRGDVPDALSSIVSRAIGGRPHRSLFVGDGNGSAAHGVPQRADRRQRRGSEPVACLQEVPRDRGRRDRRGGDRRGRRMGAEPKRDHQRSARAGS